MARFPSEEWVKLYKDALNSSPWTQSGKDWTYGPVALVVFKNERIGLKDDFCIILDIERGVCKDAKVVSREEAERQPFCIYGDYERWKQVIKGELDPIRGLAQGKLKLKGDLPTIVRFSKAAQDMVVAARQVPTEFPDE